MVESSKLKTHENKLDAIRKGAWLGLFCVWAFERLDYEHSDVRALILKSKFKTI